MTVGSAAPAAKGIFQRSKIRREQPIKNDLKADNTFTVDVHAARATKGTTFQDAITQHAKLKEHYAHDMAKWNEVINIGEYFKEIERKSIHTVSTFWNMWDGNLGTMKATEHSIELTEDARPYFQPPYRTGPTQSEQEKKEIDRMIKGEVIEPSTHEWVASVVLAPKK